MITSILICLFACVVLGALYLTLWAFVGAGLAVFGTLLICGVIGALWALFDLVALFFKGSDKPEDA